MVEETRVSTFMTKDCIVWIKAQEQMVTFSTVMREISLKLAILEGRLDQNLCNMESVKLEGLSTKENCLDVFSYLSQSNVALLQEIELDLPRFNEFEPQESIYR